MRETLPTAPSLVAAAVAKLEQHKPLDASSSESKLQTSHDSPTQSPPKMTTTMPMRTTTPPAATSGNNTERPSGIAPRCGAGASKNNARPKQQKQQQQRTAEIAAAAAAAAAVRKQSAARGFGCREKEERLQREERRLLQQATAMTHGRTAVAARGNCLTEAGQPHQPVRRQFRAPPRVRDIAKARPPSVDTAAAGTAAAVHSRTRGEVFEVIVDGTNAVTPAPIAPYDPDFATALADFDRTAQDVLNFVAERTQQLPSDLKPNEVAPIAGAETTPPSSDVDSSSSDDDNDNRHDDRSRRAETLINDPNPGLLETIAEEERERASVASTRSKRAPSAKSNNGGTPGAEVRAVANPVGVCNVTGQEEARASSLSDSSDSSVGGGRNSSGSSSSGSTSADSSDDGGDGRARLTPDGGNNDWIAVDYDDDDDDEDSDDNDDGADIIATQSASDLSSDEGCAASGAPEPAPLIDTKDGSSSLNCSGDFQWIPRKGSGPRETPQTHPVAAVCQKPPLPLGKDPMRPTTMADQQVDRVPSPTELLPSKPPLSRSSSATNNNIKRRSLTDNKIPPLATSAGGDGASGSSRGAVLSGGSLDRRQRHKHHHHHHHHQQQQQQQYQQQQLYQQHHHHQNAPQSYTSSSSSSRSERDQKARSTHLTHNRSAASPPRLDDYLRMPPPHPPPGSTGGGLAANLYPPTMHGPPPPAMYYGCYCCPPPQTSYLQPQQYFAEAAAPNGGGYADTFHRRHEHTDPQRYGSSPMLVVGGGAGAGPSLIGSHSAAQRVPVLLSGSHPDLFSDGASGNVTRLRNNGADRGLMSPPLPLTPQPCYPYHVMPMVPTHHTAGSGGCGNCCYTGDMGRGGFHWTPPAMIKPPDIDEKCRKLTSERDNLQLQVQVLSEQIEAQSDKITDLERAVHEKKQILSNTEDLLQRETLSRSSLETQKLELISQISEMKLLQASLERENMELRATCHFNNNPIDGKKPSYMSRMSPQPQLTSTPIHQSSNNALNIRSSPSPTPLNIGAVTNLIPTSARRTDNCAPTHEFISQSPKTPPANFNRKVELHYASLPRQQYLSNGPHALSLSASSASFTAGVLPSHDKSSSSPAAAVDANANPAAAPGACATTTNGGGGGGKKGVAFGRGLSSLLGGRAKGHSVPNLADSEKIVIDDIANGTGPSPSVEGDNENQSPAGGKNKAGIKKIFGRLKRSGSGNLEDLPAGVGDFQRGGVRATATARLGWSEPHINKKPIKPFGEWDTDLVCEWLTDLGLEQYVLDARRWIKSGQQLHEAPASDLEKELQIRNPLHKKKLQLALIDVEENSSSDPFLSLAGKLDTSWVLRWLDDTGMPQYKESFLLNRIDGRVLHRLTMDDLAAMHVTSLMHVASLRRGIQVLRENRYEADCLQRRAIPGEDPQEPTPADICLWSTHRVMEWLREVDLAEYAPNLRGAGVHGGIMVLETKFTSELLATLLSIPSSKTLLRRHLNTHFKDLLGKDLIQAKREAESILGYVPLTPASKIKVPKKSHFSLKRSKSKSEADYGDLVCPLGAQSGEQLNGSALNSTMGMMRMIKLKEEDAFHLADDSADSLPNSYPQSATNSPVPLRYESS